jgi:DNA-dependent metalloprotease WSS1
MAQPDDTAEDKTLERLERTGEESKCTPTEVPHDTMSHSGEAVTASKSICGACSWECDQNVVICHVCSNVLRPDLMDHWTCTSGTCRKSSYINAGDYGRCQVCGQPKP